MRSYLQPRYSLFIFVTRFVFHIFSTDVSMCQNSPNPVLNVFSLLIPETIYSKLQALQGSWNIKTKRGDCHYTAASAMGNLEYPNRCFFMNFFIHFMVMGRLAENIIFITLKITESYEQSAGSMIGQCCRLTCVGKGVLLQLDNVSL